MTLERQGFDAVRLGDGTVLAVGSDQSCAPGGAIEGSETAEAYDPTADTWSAVESLNKPRKSPATVSLASGRALVIGGLNADDIAFSSTKIFDPDDPDVVERATARACSRHSPSPPASPAGGCSS